MFKDALYLRRLYEKYYGKIEPKLVSKYMKGQEKARGHHRLQKP